MNDGTERLRGQFRDAAQGSRGADDYGGDKIEDTAVDGSRQAVRGAEQIVRQMQRSKESKTATSYPQPESEPPIDVPPDVGDSTPTVQPASPVDPQPKDSRVTPSVRVREPVVAQVAAEHPPIKEKTERITVSEKPATTACVGQDGPAVKTRERPVTVVPQDRRHSPQRPHTQPVSISTPPAVGDSTSIVQPASPVDSLPRDNGAKPPVREREPVVAQVAAEHPLIKEKAERITVSEKPATAARVSQDGPSVKTREWPVTVAPQDIRHSLQHPHTQPASILTPPAVGDSTPIAQPSPPVDPQPRTGGQFARESSPDTVPIIKEKSVQPHISEKPAITSRVSTERRSVMGKENSAVDIGVTGQPRQGGGGPPVNQQKVMRPTADRQQTSVETPAIKEHGLTADIRTRPDISQLPIKTREVERTMEGTQAVPATVEHNVQPNRTVGHFDVRSTVSRHEKTVRESKSHRVQPDTGGPHRSDARRKGKSKTGIKERTVSSRSKAKIEKNRTAIGRPARKAVKSTDRSAQAARKIANQIIQTRQRIERARRTLHTAGTIVKRSAEAVVKALQATGAALKGVLSAAIAGGGITVAVVLVISLAGFLLASPLGMFFSDEVNTGPAIQDTIVQLNGEFTNRIEQLKEENPYDALDLDNAGVTAALSNWRDVLAVYAVRVTTDSVNPSDVLTLTAEKQAILRATFWDMSVVNFDTETVSGTDRLHITISTKNALQMADEYGFTADQRKLLEEMLSPAYQEFFQQLTGNFRNITLTAEQIQQIMDNLPASLSTQRKQVILTAYQLLGKVNCFWGGKSLVLGWDSRWGTPREVTAAGSPSSGTIRPYGLDCSGFVDWVFYNVSNGGYVIGHGGGARMQHRHCTNISWSQAIPGDLVFYPEDTHVGIVCGFDESGNVLIIHCASGANNVVVTGRRGFTSIARPNYYSE